MQKCTVHGDRTKPDVKHIVTRFTEHKSFISSSYTIIANIKCTLWQVSILENRFSGKSPFGQMYILAKVNSGKQVFGEMPIRPNVHSGKCTFREMYILASVRSGKCPFGIMYFWPSVFRGNILSGRCFSGRCTGSHFAPLLFRNCKIVVIFT